MKKCPSCSYGNPDCGGKCCICGRDISGVAAVPLPVPEKGSGLMLAYGIALLVCAGLFLLLQPLLKTAPAPAPAVSDEAYPAEGILYSLEKMSGLAYLPPADRLAALPLLSSREEKVAFAAAKAVGAWARSERDPDLARTWLEKLLDTAVSGRGAARRQAALEAAFALAFGADPALYAGGIKAASSALVREGDPALKGAGFLLSAMAGSEEHVGQMRDTLLHDPVRASRLYAACALSRLGDPAGHKYLAGTAAGGDPELAPEALACLSYSASPDAERLLASAARDGLRAAAAESAKRALMLRKQLAIIKK